MRAAKIRLTGLFLLLVGTALGQCPATDFSIPATACSSENLFATNLTAGSNTYSWDFCSGELANAPTPTPILTSGLLFRARSLRIANDAGVWTGFAIDQALNRLVRLDFGSDPSNTPTLADLGNPSGALNGAFDFQLYQEGANWYALVVNSGNNTLVNIHFGTTLQTLSPSVQNLGTLSVLNVPNAIKLINDAGALTGFVSNGGAAEIVRLDFGTSITNTPATAVLPVPGANGLRGIDLVRECDRWFGLVTSYNDGGVYWLDFNNGLQQAPQTGAISFFTSYLFPASLAIAWDGDTYYSFIQSALGSVYKLDFGSSIIDKNGTGSDLGNLGISNENFALSLFRQGSVWFGHSIDLTTQRLVRLAFPENCQASLGSFLGDTPPSISYANAGVRRVTLETVSNTGATDAISKLVTVSGSTAPDVDFSITNSCRDHDVLFNSINISGGITGYLWGFGDATASTAPNPVHQYSSSGLKSVELRLQASNGCFNRQRKTLEVEDPPVADITLPSVTPLCTNQAYLFSNTSVIDPQSSPVWEWRLNGVVVSSLQDFETTFTTATPQEIRLKVLIPGCENEVIENIASVLLGPLVDFSVPDNCEQQLVTFSNSTTGADAGYLWDFGDGSPTSGTAEPNHVYTNPGVYPVTLTGINTGGCNNFVTRSVTVYSVPQPDFSVGLPPFSCSGSPTLFQNNTPALTDSNISDWNWEFGDPANSISTVRDPSFTYTAGGNYSVDLTATSDAGCSQTISKLVTIGTSPAADFANGPACINQGTQFSDISIGGVQSRTWQIGGSIFTSPNPTYTFISSGTHHVTLTVTATGGCDDVITKPIVVPVLPTLTLEVENPCADQPTTFTLVDGTSPPFIDPVVGWQWNIAGTSTTGNPATGTVSLPGLSPVSVTTTHASGCSYIQMNQVNIHPSPVADFTATPDRGNTPLTVQFQNQSTGATQYQWIFSGNPPGFSNEVSPLHTFLALGDFSAELTVINADGCSDIKTIPIQVLVPTIDLVLTEFTLSPDALTGKLKPTVTVMNNSNIPVSNIELAIHLSDRATITESVVVDLAVGASATKTLAVTVDPNQFSAAFVCAEVLSEKDVVEGDNRQCISFSDADYVFDPYPNPVTGLLYVDWVSEGPGTASITIYNSQGRREYEWQTPSSAGLNQSIHDLSFLAPGVYFVTVQTSKNIQTRRFVRL